MKKLLLITAMFLAANFTFAGVDKGDKELAFSFSYTDTSNALTYKNYDKTTFILDVGIGFFLNKNNEILFLLTYMKIDNFDEEDVGTFGFGYRFNFIASEKIVPFIGVRVAQWFGDASDYYDSSWGIEGGSRFFINDRWSVNTLLFYQTNTAKERERMIPFNGFVELDVYDDETNIGIAVGLSVFF